jgi:membrane-associated phospholipid phosphatase
VGPREYITSPLLFATAAVFNYAVHRAESAAWTGPILFDGDMREALAAETAEGRARARLASDLFFLGSMAHPVLFDNVIVTLLLRNSPDVAWQMLWINAQSYGLTLALNTGTKRLTSRQRPWGDRCPEASDEVPCGERSQFLSFYSGHAAVTATGAGLLCAHHTQLALYRHPGLDTAACGVAIFMTAATGALRIASDNHWASDVLMGHLMGYLSGYLMPTLLYYREFRVTPEKQEHAPKAPVVTLAPVIGPSSAQVAAIGMF